MEDYEEVAWTLLTFNIFLVLGIWILLQNRTPSGNLTIRQEEMHEYYVCRKDHYLIFLERSPDQNTARLVQG